MQTQHTPGPWKDGPVFGKTERAIFWTDTSKPGTWQRRLDDKLGAFKEADARLIAAAPDLLEALQWLVNAHDAPTGRDGVMRDIPQALERARAAIAKAT